MQAVKVNSPTRFFGLFVGINNYVSGEINALKSAVRDASALHALFSDNVGGSCQLVFDADATRQRILDELEAIRRGSTKEDIVVITFSGHGSDTHELVTHDTDPYDLRSTGIPLDELTALVSAIEAKHLLVVLDCCFSGGAGAKVLKAPLVPRGVATLSTDALLGRMAGVGRLILTASTADQEAWEDVNLGHGFLTYHLIQALMGAPEVTSTDRFSLYELLSYVVRRVKASASGTAAAKQEPSLRGQIDGEIIWPVFKAGQLYLSRFPNPSTAPVTGDLRSLQSHGISDDAISVWSGNLPALNNLQQAAINEAGLLRGKNVLVMAPTSSGKTMIGELAALRATQNGGRSVFLLPTKALVNEQYDRFSRIYGSIGVRTVRATGDISDQLPSILLGQFDLALFTYEKFSGLALRYPHLLRMISVVVIDEVQALVDPSRGENLEFLLTFLKSRAEEGIEPQVVALSAVLGDLGGLDSWLDAYLLRHEERPVPLDEGVLTFDGRYRFVNPEGAEQAEQLIQQPYGEFRARTLLIPLVRKLVNEGQQVIVIRGIRGQARSAARYLAAELELDAATDALAQLPTGDPSAASQDLRYCLQGGVAFHISDLDREERRVVEQSFRAPNSALRVIVATTTLAQGVNLPAETVIMPELSRRTGPTTFSWYTVADYKNIAGRAGRMGMTDRGRAIVLALGGADESHLWSQYVKGKPENVESRLLQAGADAYTLVLKVVAAASVRSESDGLRDDDIIAFLASSFGAHQARLTGNGDAFEPEHIREVLNELMQQQFVERGGSFKSEGAGSVDLQHGNGA